MITHDHSRSLTITHDHSPPLVITAVVANGCALGALASSIKIGDAVIQYTFNKLRRQGLIEDSEVIPLFEHYDPYKSTIENVIAQTKLSHNRPDKLKVIKLNRKENNVLQLHNK